MGSRTEVRTFLFLLGLGDRTDEINNSAHGTTPASIAAEFANAEVPRLNSGIGFVFPFKYIRQCPWLERTQ
jgi:hypothetical protein